MVNQRSAPVVVVGAGLAGLACAQRLSRAGIDVVVYEASDAVGGRVRTDLIDGFRCDRGFQLINPSYPVLGKVLDLAELDLRAFDAGVVVAVRDSGSRLDAQRAEQVFEAFYTTKARGLGIGLSISRSIVEAHGGRLWAEANAPHGAVFALSLPVES